MPRRRISTKYRYREVEGWKPDPEHAREFAAKNPTPVFATAAPKLMDRELRDVFIPAYQIKACKEKFGKTYRYTPQHQYRGTCVGQSHKSLVDQTNAVWRFIGGGKFEGLSAVCTGYAGSRVEIAGWVSRSDGSNGSWIAEWLTKKRGTGGVVLLKSLGLDEFDQRQDEKYATDWAASRQGVPSEFEDVARIRPLKNASLILTVPELQAAIQNLQPVNICTPYIPSPRRNSDGVSAVSRQGGHSTLICGMRKIGRRWVYPYLQSWGNWATGNYGWDKFDPEGHYRTSIVDLEERDIERILQSRDCYTFFGPQGVEPISKRYWI